MLTPQKQSTLGWRTAVAATLLALAVAACTSKSPQTLIASGKELAAKNDHLGASIQFKSALQLDPNSLEARVLFGKALLGLRDADAAVIELTRALIEKAPPEDVIPTLARAWVLLGESKKLILTYGNTTLSDKSAQAALLTELAGAWFSVGDMAKTEASIAKALVAVPDFGPAKIIEARILAGKGRLDESAKVADGILSRDQNSHEGWLLRGDLLNVKGEHKAAEESYLKAVALDRTFVKAHAAIIGLRIGRGDIKGAKQQTELMRLVAPIHPVTALVDAQLAYTDGDFPRARDLVQKLLLVFPSHKSILVLAGAVDARLGAVVQAEAHFGRALAIDPELHVARENLAETQSRLGQHAKALEVLKPLLRGEATSARALSLAGQAEMRLNDPAAAQSYFQRAAKLDPTNNRLHTAVLMARLSGGDGAGAIADLQVLSGKSDDIYADEALFAAHMARREFGPALTVLDTLARKQPGQALHLEMRGRVHQARRDYPAARQAFEDAFKADPGLFDAIVSLVTMDLTERKATQAMARVESVVAASPKNSSALLLLADLKARNGAPVPEVKGLLADAVRVSPTLPEPRIRQIEYALRKRQFKDALIYAREALGALPGDVQVLEAAGLAQLRAGDVEQAASTFRKLATALPASAEPHLRLAEVFATQGKSDASESSLLKALELEPSNLSAQSALVDLLIGSNRKRNAVEYVRQVRQARPDLPSVYMLEAAYHMRVKSPDLALAALREGLTKTGSTDLAGKLFGALLQAGRTAEANKFGEAWISQHPKDAAFEYLLSQRDVSRGDAKGAEARLKRVLAAYPSHPGALNLMAWVLVSSGNKDSIGYAQRAVDLLPERPALMDTLALALATDKQFAEALTIQRRAIELAPEDNILRLTLAKLAIQSGDSALARTELMRLQQLGTAFKAQAEVSKLLQGL